MSLVFARRSVRQSYTPTSRVLSMMLDYRGMTNDAIRIGLANNACSLKKLSKLCYKELKGYKIPALYKLCAISKAAGILASRKKSIMRGYQSKDPRLKKPMLVSYRGFKIMNGRLRVTVSEGEYEYVDLNSHTIRMLKLDEKAQVKSFTITERFLSLCLTKEVSFRSEIQGAIGVDRNLRNVAVGNQSFVTFYDTRKILHIGETCQKIVGSVKRNDDRIRRIISSKYGWRRKERIGSILNNISKHVVRVAKGDLLAIVFEDIRYIRSLYQKRNHRGKYYRRQMNNHWPFNEIKKQIEYKAQWEGIPVIHLTKKETRGTSKECVRCGERLQSAFWSDVEHKRQLWCERCEKWLDRDLVAVMNISRRGWLRFGQSKGIGSEAMVQEREGTELEPLILKVDPMKLTQKR